MDANWDFPGCCRADRFEFYLETDPAFVVYLALSRRLTTIKVHQKWQKMYEAALAIGHTEDGAKHFADVKVVIAFLAQD
jgi:hypothetical protein